MKRHAMIHPPKFFRTVLFVGRPGKGHFSALQLKRIAGTEYKSSLSKDSISTNIFLSSSAMVKEMNNQ